MLLSRRSFSLPRFADLSRELDNLIDNAGNVQAFSFNCRGAVPALDIHEDAERLVVEADVPGLTMSDLDISIESGGLTIQGGRKPVEHEGATVHRRERGTGEFKRVLSLPIDVDVEQVEAVLANGVLTVTLPKAADAKVRKIEVRGE